MTQERKRTILVSRTDRAGDLVLTLPVFQTLHLHLPEARLIAHVRSYTESLVRDRPDVHQVLIDDPNGSQMPLLTLSRLFRQHQIDLAILVHPTARAILACFLAGVSVRIGRASNLWQIFLTHREVQHRSRNEKHESAYNLDLLRPLGLNPEPVLPRLFFSNATLQTAKSTLQTLGMNSSRLVFVHPGHGGSAFNMSPGKYRQLVESLLKSGYCVVVTLGPGEEHLQSQFPPHDTGRLSFLTNVADLQTLAAIFSLGKAFCGGSTGPMHLASAVGLPTVAFFPPHPAMKPTRWGPCRNPSLVLIPEIQNCLGTCASCGHHQCMESGPLAPALAWLKDNVCDTVGEP